MQPVRGLTHVHRIVADAVHNLEAARSHLLIHEMVQKREFESMENAYHVGQIVTLASDAVRAANDLEDKLGRWLTWRDKVAIANEIQSVNEVQSAKGDENATKSTA